MFPNLMIFFYGRVDKNFTGIFNCTDFSFPKPYKQSNSNGYEIFPRIPDLSGPEYGRWGFPPISPPTLQMVHTLSFALSWWLVGCDVHKPTFCRLLKSWK